MARNPIESAESARPSGYPVTARTVAIDFVVVMAAILVLSVWLGVGIPNPGGSSSSAVTAAPPIPLTLETDTGPTLPPGAAAACPQARYGSGPVRVSRNGSAMVFTSTIEHLVWPRGYTAWVVDGLAELRSPTGEVVAHEGDLLELGGGLGPGGDFYVCSIALVVQ